MATKQSWDAFYQPFFNTGSTADRPGNLNLELRDGNANEIAKLIRFGGAKTTPLTYTQGGINEGGDTAFQAAGNAYTPEFLEALRQYQFMQADPYRTAVVDQGGNNLGTFQSGDEESAFDKFAWQAVPLAIAAMGAGALGGWVPGTEGAGSAIGNGAFLGEGVASGIPAWDAAAGMSGSLGSAGVGGLADFGGYSLAADGVGSMAPEMMAANGIDAATLYGSELGAATAAGSSAGSSPLSWGSLAKAAIGPALSTGLQMYGANKAAGAMQDATNRANELDAPALAARNSALAQMQALLKDPSTITKSPDYQFGLDAGTKALNNGAAARGMTYSGAQGKALQRYGQDYAGTKLDQSFNRLNALASAGQPGATATSNNITAQGNTDAAKYLVGGNALGTAVNGLTAYGQRQGWWGAPG